MTTISNKKILSLIAALVVAHSPSATAGETGLRSRQHQDDRSLKKQGKEAGSNYQPGATALFFNSDSATINQLTEATQPPTAHPFSVEGFDRKCPNQESNLERCVERRGGTDTTKSICKKCILGVASFTYATIYTLDSCSNPEINDGACRECYDEAENYYKCGTDSNLERNLRDGAEYNTDSYNNDHSEPTGHFAPASFCPIAAPGPNDSCEIEGYDYLECYYSHMICACREDNPFFTCEEEA